jgi:predicted Zn-dependent protease
MAAFNKFNPFIEAVFEGTHNFATNTFKVMLTNTAPVAANGVKADITEIAAGNGYTAGGQTVTINTSSQTGGAYTAAVNQTLTWTATGGSIAALRYAVMYNDTAASKNLVGWWDYGSSVTPAVGETFQWVMNANLISAS